MKNIGGNALVIKEVNINLVRKVLKAKKQATKRQLAELTGLSNVTVGTVLQQLVKQNEVREAGLSSSSGGRPAQQYLYNEEYSLALILFPHEREGDILIHGTVVNLSGGHVYETEVKTEQVDLGSFEQLIDTILAEYPSIQAIGFGLPGAEYDGRMVASVYESFLDVSVTEHFSTRYGKPVIMENDVNAAVIGFCNRTQAAADSTVIYIYFPERFPPGAGIYIHGKLYRGKRNFAGELGPMPIGISWGEASLLASFELLTEGIAKLTVAISSVLNPDTVVLHGSFLNAEHMEAITGLCSAQLPPNSMPQVILSEDFAADYLQGMIVQTLNTLEPDLQLTK
jgi:hypothetical protein